MLGSFLEVQGFYDALALTVRQNGEVFGAYKSLGQGGIPVRVIETFLGKASAGLVKDNGPLMAQLRRMHAGGTALVASTGPTAPPPDPLVKTPGWFVGQHSYSLLDYDEMAQTVTARNPWGARPDPDGVVMLPLGTFLQSFESYSYSEPPAPKPTGQ